MNSNNIEPNFKEHTSGARDSLNIDSEEFKNMFNIGLLDSIEEYIEEYSIENANFTNTSFNSLEDKAINHISIQQIEEILSDLGNTQLGPVGFYVLLVLYILVICIGISGNVIVLIAILWKQSMRTPHNFFIAALAVSGMLG